MYELIHVLGNTYYINCPAKMGLYVEDSRAYLIDSGNDKDAGKKVIKILDSQGWKLEAVINTHSHADHIGGNKLLAERTGAKIYTNGIEKAFTEYTNLESSYLYGGYPYKALRNKFLMAEKSMPNDIANLAMPKGMEVFPLKGHFFDMIGVRTPDDVCFIADSISGANIIEKYHIGFLYDVAGCLETLDDLENMSAKAFVPAHAEVFSEDLGNLPEFKKLIEINRKNVFDTTSYLLKLCEKPMGFDMILKKVFDDFNLTMDFSQNVLMGSTVKSYLSYLIDTGKLEPRIIDNILHFCALAQ